MIHCHCNLCRQLSGSAFTTWVSLQKPNVQFYGETALSAFSPSPNTTRYFCKLCGTHVYTSDMRQAEIIGVPAGIFTDSMQLKPTEHYFLSHKASWHEIHDDLQRYGGKSGYEALDFST